MAKRAQKSKEAALPPGLTGAQLDRLYSAPLGEFIAERKALAKELREAGEDEAAQDVAELRKPTAAAWLINQLAHRDHEQLDRFLAASKDLAQAQDEALSGSGGQHLRDAQRTQRDAIQALVQSVRAIGDKPSEQAVDRVRETLEAAVENEEVRRLVKRGWLPREARPGSVPEAPAGVAKRTKAKPKEDKAAQRRELSRLQKQLREAERDEKRLAEEVEEAERRLKDSRADLRDAKQAARKARRKAESAEKRLI